jgi:hypothetical protein
VFTRVFIKLLNTRVHPRVHVTPLCVHSLGFSCTCCARMRTHTASRNPVFMPVLRLNIILPCERPRVHVKTENHPRSPFDRPTGGARRRLSLRNHPGCRRRERGGLRKYGRPFCPGFLMVRPNCRPRLALRVRLCVSMSGFETVKSAVELLFYDPQGLRNLQSTRYSMVLKQGVPGGLLRRAQRPHVNVASGRSARTASTFTPDSSPLSDRALGHTYVTGHVRPYGVLPWMSRIS